MITLDQNDVRQAAHVAFDRGFVSIMRGLKNTNGGMNDPFLRHVIGALGECAFAKHANIYWDGSVNRFKGQGQDVGAFQIRTRSGRLPLIIRPTDSDTDIFVLVCMGKDLTEWEVVGQIAGKEAKQIGTLTPMQGGDRYLIDPAKLKPITKGKQP